jgi:hypothetical protein
MSREGIAFLQGIAGFCECGVEHHWKQDTSWLADLW